jgi:uncharacterized protein YdeI (YjbR/CyaY-like superfamily)
MPSFKQTLKEFEPRNRQALRDWLAKNHDKSPGIWLLLHKKGSDKTVITWHEVVEEVLCFGWIDSTPNKLDEQRYKLMITPRKPGSVWSKINKERIEKLVKEKLMMPPGLAKIEQAKKDGSWDTLNETDNLVVPPDLAKALTKNKTAKKNFEGFNPGSRKQILWYIFQAKQPATREKRIAETIAMAAVGLKANYPPDVKKFRT